MDFDAPALAQSAIQGLAAELKDRDTAIAELKGKLFTSDQKLAVVEMRLQAIEDKLNTGRTSSAALGLALGLPAAAGLFFFRRRQRKA